MALGYDGTLYILAFDHRGSFRKMLGITGTPGFLINGRYLSGARPFDSFKEMIDAELERG